MPPISISIERAATPGTARHDDAWLSLLPRHERILEIGAATGDLPGRYRERFPTARWQRADMPAATVDGPFDAVVLGDVPEQLAADSPLFDLLRRATSEDARLYCRIANASHAARLEQLLVGDQVSGPAHTPSGIIKVLLDAGWLPEIAHTESLPHPRPLLPEALFAATAAVGLPRSRAERLHGAASLFVSAMKSRFPASAPAMPAVSVIVPVSRDLQLDLNIRQSPGLAEMAAEIVLCRGAASAAEAFAGGKAQASGEWLLYCHQDVYFPRGFAAALAAELAGAGDMDRQGTLFGFAGLAIDAAGNVGNAGFVIDRTARFDFPATTAAISMDEFAILVHRDFRRRPDPALGWHLWATDLCLQGIFDPAGACYGRILRAPVFHNSFAPYRVPDEFHASAARLAARYPFLPVIPTLCGNVTAAGA